MVDLKDQLRNPNYAKSSSFARAYMIEAADRIAALEAQLAEAKEAFAAIDGLAVMEINPSNYDHDDVCELNRNASHASVIARDALSDLEVTQPAPEITGKKVEAAARALAECAWNRSNTSDSNFMKMKYPGGKIQYIEEMWQTYSDDASAALTAAHEF